jgi:hypothetical protein
VGARIAGVQANPRIGVRYSGQQVAGAEQPEDIYYQSTLTISQRQFSAGISNKSLHLNHSTPCSTVSHFYGINATNQVKDLQQILIN